LTDEAISDFRKSVELKPDLAEAYYNMGNIYYNRNQSEESIREFDRALSIHRDYARAYLNKALACEKLSRIDDARSAYEGFLRSARHESKELVDFVSQRLRDLSLRGD